MKKFILACLAVFVVAATAGFFTAGTLKGYRRISVSQVSPLDQFLVSEITTDVLKSYAYTLAADDMEGRNAGYPGNDKAAEFIAKKFSEYGLKPGGDKDTYLHHFSFDSVYTGGNQLKTQNVIGYIEGTDPKLKDEYVVLGAHYDHVGRASEGRHLGRLGLPDTADEIWNGADDNASGTSCLLAVAKALTASGISFKRTIVFICFSAEEGGLIGSARFVKNPTLGKIENYVFMLNLDMVGRNADKPVQVKGLGSAEGEVLRTIANAAVNKASRLSDVAVAADYSNGTETDGDSDHTSFLDEDIPAVFFFTGLHKDYHRISDTADKLEYGQMVTLSRAAALMIAKVADLDARLVFNK